MSRRTSRRVSGWFLFSDATNYKKAVLVLRRDVRRDMRRDKRHKIDYENILVITPILDGYFELIFGIHIFHAINNNFTKNKRNSATIFNGIMIILYPVLF